MKLDPKRYAAALREGAATAVRRHPVEMALLLCFSVLWCLAFEFDWSFERLGVRLIVGFWYALAMFVVERWTGRGPWRRIYYVAWVPLVPLLLWPGLAEWVESTRFVITSGTRNGPYQTFRQRTKNIAGRGAGLSLV